MVTSTLVGCRNGSERAVQFQGEEKAEERRRKEGREEGEERGKRDGVFEGRRLFQTF